jgi:hypothetical protein
MVIRTGILGLSPGNGHPFSFSAIVNGYDDERFGEAGWPVIHAYLRREAPDRFGLPDVRVTGAWTEDAAITRTLCAACRIDRAYDRPEDMIGEVEAVIVARDDWETHAPLAMPFLERGAAVFVDKPLSLDETELAAFEPYLRAGRLMSCSGLRYAAELDSLRRPPVEWETGATRLVTATVLLGIELYGIHPIEALAGLGVPFNAPAAVTRLDVPHDGFLIQWADGTPFVLHCLGAVAKTFHVSVYGERGHRHFDLHDNFSAFRRTLEAFFDMVRSGRPPIAPDETLGLMRLIATARRLAPGETARLDVAAGEVHPG